MPVVEVGWRFAPAHWNRGYATEAGQAAVAWGFTHLPLNEIVAFVRPANVRSQRVMDRLGMVRDPAADFDHPHMTDPAIRPHWLYRLHKLAWSENRQNLVAKVEPLKS
jgi:ribosomal-protein-alanine N-acetyltransferase